MFDFPKYRIKEIHDKWEILSYSDLTTKIEIKFTKEMFSRFKKILLIYIYILVEQKNSQIKYFENNKILNNEIYPKNLNDNLIFD